MKVILAQPRGFCAGVVRAIEIVERALQKYGPPVYVRHEIVHNKHVVESLKAKGARFVEDLSEVPPNAVTIFSAHGVAKSVEEEAASRELPVLNATCPLVTKVHNQGKRYVGQGRRLILIGHAGHPEVEGTMGQIAEPVTLVQTESDVDIARHSGRHAGRLCHPDHAERRRHPRHHRSAACALHRHRRPGDPRHLLRDAEPPDRGARTIEAGRRYPGGRSEEQFQFQPAARDRRRGRHAQLSDRRRQRSRAGLVRNAKTVGITAGASAPEVLVEDVIDALRRLGPVDVSELTGRQETIEFRLPPELTDGGNVGRRATAKV